jgi:hypothetical protein
VQTIDHLLNRESEEREAAGKATSPHAREIHLMLAERYADEAWILAEETPGCAPIPSAVWAHAALRLRTRTSAATDPVGDNSLPSI